MSRARRTFLPLLATLSLGLSPACKSSEEQAKKAPEPAPAPTTALPPPFVAASAQVAAPPDVAEPPADAQKLPSGLRMKVLQAGTGSDHPRDQDEMDISYVGWKKNGEMFDRSGQPMTMRLLQLMPGWNEGMKHMVQGEKRRLWVPAKLAYGDTPPPGVPAGDLTLDVELVELYRVGDPPIPPSDLASPPKTAIRTPSGLVYVTLQEGTGKSPGPKDVVRVKYSGFTAEGTAFDSTNKRGRAKKMHVDQVIKGWSEGLQLMKVGGKAQFWLPPELAYGNEKRAGVPSGPLVFVTELTKIEEPDPTTAAR